MLYSGSTHSLSTAWDWLDHAVYLMLYSGSTHPPPLHCMGLVALNLFIMSAQYHREERLAAAISRSREHRHDTQMKGREEFLASSITSALRERRGDRERNNGGIGGTFSRMHVSAQCLKPGSQ